MQPESHSAGGGYEITGYACFITYPVKYNYLHCFFAFIRLSSALIPVNKSIFCPGENLGIVKRLMKMSVNRYLQVEYWGREGRSMGYGISGMFRFGWAVNIAGRGRTERTSKDRKAQQTAGRPLVGHEHPGNTIDRPGEQRQTAQK
jgi:hypothetical protein